MFEGYRKVTFFQDLDEKIIKDSETLTTRRNPTVATTSPTETTPFCLPVPLRGLEVRIVLFCLFLTQTSTSRLPPFLVNPSQSKSPFFPNLYPVDVSGPARRPCDESRQTKTESRVTRGTKPTAKVSIPYDGGPPPHLKT